MQNDTGVPLADRLLVVCVDQKCKRHAVSAERRLNDIGHILFIRLGIKIFHRFAAVVGMLRKVVIGAVRHAPELAPAEREQILKVGRCLGVEAKLVRIMVAQSEIVARHAEIIEELLAVILPVFEPFEVGAGFAEKLQLHLLKLADTEDKVAGRDLVAERLADLTDAEGELLARGARNVLEVDEDPLRRLGAEIQLGGGILSDTLIGLEHQIELADVGEVLRTAGRACDPVVRDVLGHFLVCPAGRIDVEMVLCRVILDQLIGAMTRFARLAAHQRVGKAADVTGSNPDLGVHDDRAVKTDIVLAVLHKALPPCALDVVLELNAERTVIPRVCKTAVDLGTGIHKAAVFAECNDLVHCFFGIIHVFLLLSIWKNY